MAHHQALAPFLVAAEKLLREQVVANCTGDARFGALMAASAIGMAAREIELETFLESATADISELVPQPSPFADPAVALTHLVRAGLMDGQHDLYRRLLVQAITRTAVTRPAVVLAKERRLAGLE